MKLKNYFEIVSQIGSGKCTRFHLEHIKNGAFRDDIETYIRLQLIHEVGRMPDDDPIYALTAKGHRVWRGEIKMEDNLREKRE